MEMPPVSDIFKAAPIASIICAVAFFGFWLRGKQVESQDKTIEILREILRTNGRHKGD
jgi:hypothetical protein